MAECNNGNGLPGDLELLKPWFPFVRRLRKTYNGSAVTLVRAMVILDERGVPILWLEPESQHLEPGATAGEALKGLLAGLAGASQ